MAAPVLNGRRIRVGRRVGAGVARFSGGSTVTLRRTTWAVMRATAQVLIGMAAVATLLNLLSPLFNWPRNGGPAW